MHINEIVLEISGYPSKKRLTLWAGTSDLFPFPFPFPFPSTDQSVLRIRYSNCLCIKSKIEKVIFNIVINI